ncbi:hypothetical protein X777_11717, partial [Ooceraea biroi]
KVACEKHGGAFLREKNFFAKLVQFRVSTAGLQFMSMLRFLLIVMRISVVLGLYFPQSNLTLRFPYVTQYDAKVLPVKLIGLRTLHNDSVVPQNVEYRLFTTQENIASYQENTSNVMLQSLPKNGALNTIVIEANKKGFGEAVLEIKVQPVLVKGKTVNCADYIQDMCFWNTSSYRIYENQPVTMIGMFGPEAYRYLCPKFHVRYDLLNGKYLRRVVPIF